MRAELLARARAAGALRPGWPMLAGAGLLLLCAILYATGALPARQRLEEIRERTALLQHARAARVEPDALPPAEQLARFRGIFPPEADALQLAGQVMAAAQRHGLAARQAAYRFDEDKGLRLTRMQVAMPLKGDYVAVRRFLADVRQEIPALALEQVQFERRAVGERQLEAQVTLRIYLERR